MCTNKETITAFISKSIPELTRNARAKLSEHSKNDLNECDIRWELHNKKIECEKANEQIRELQNKIDNLRIEWRSQQEHLGKLNQEYIQLQQTLGEHSIYCATLGATMGSLLWKVSRLDGAIESMLESNRINQMLIIMDNSLKAFIEVFGRDIPDPYGNEYQFVLSWMGILTNISACPDGRYYLLNKCEGQQLITNLIDSVQKLTHHNGVLLQRMILMILYNLMINANGVIFIQNHTEFTSILSKTLLNCKVDKEIQDLIYKLMYALTQNILTCQYLKHLKETLPWGHIETTICDRQSPNQDIANKIKINCKNMENKIQMEKLWNNRPEELIVGMALNVPLTSTTNVTNKKYEPSQKISAHTFVKTPSKSSIHSSSDNVDMKNATVAEKTYLPDLNFSDQSQAINFCLWGDRAAKWNKGEIDKNVQTKVAQRNSYKLEDDDLPRNTECIFSKNITLTANIVPCDDDTNPVNMKPNKDTNMNIKIIAATENHNEGEIESEKQIHDSEISTDKNKLLYTINRIMTTSTENYISKLEVDSDFIVENSVENAIPECNDQQYSPELKKHKYHCKHLCSKNCQICINKYKH